MAEGLLAKCPRTECVFFGDAPGGTDTCYCRHPEKQYHLNEIPCPLFRIDWSKTSGQEETFRKRFGIGGSS